MCLSARCLWRGIAHCSGLRVQYIISISCLRIWRNSHSSRRWLIWLWASWSLFITMLSFLASWGGSLETRSCSVLRSHILPQTLLLFSLCFNVSLSWSKCLCLMTGIIVDTAYVIGFNEPEKNLKFVQVCQTWNSSLKSNLNELEPKRTSTNLKANFNEFLKVPYFLWCTENFIMTAMIAVLSYLHHCTLDHHVDCDHARVYSMTAGSLWSFLHRDSEIM